MIRFKLLPAILLLATCISAQAEIEFAIGEPVDGSTRSGVGQISGWAVSDTQIVSVEAFIDGVSLGLVPYGGTRLDVAAAFPEHPDSEFSGWSMKWNYSLLSEGEHELTVVIRDIDNSVVSQSVLFSTTGFKSPFMQNPDAIDLSEASITTLEPGRIMVAGAMVEGESVDIELFWDTATQQFRIDRITGEDGTGETVNQAPRANAGNSLDVEAGITVFLEGAGVDQDGSIASYAWKQVTGTKVEILGADQRVAEFTAPDMPGALRFRLTVKDDEGATDSDDVIINVEASPEPDPEPAPDPGPDDDTTGETVQSMLGVINTLRSQPQVCNGVEYPAVPALEWDSGLANIARLHSMDMASKGYLSHTSDDGTSMGGRVFPYWSGTRVGENIAASSVNRSDSHVVNMWMTSTAGHCELLMSPDFTHAGIGAGQNTRNGYTYHFFWTLDFGG